MVQEAQAGAPGFPPTRPDQGHRIKTRGLVQGNIKPYFRFQLEKSTMYIGLEIQENHFKVIVPQL